MCQSVCPWQDYLAGLLLFAANGIGVIHKTFYGFLKARLSCLISKSTRSKIYFLC